jgi:hypothetical protein
MKRTRINILREVEPVEPVKIQKLVGQSPVVDFVKEHDFLWNMYLRHMAIPKNYFKMGSFYSGITIS